MIVRALSMADLDEAMGYANRVYAPGYAMLNPDMFDWQYNRCGGEDRAADNGALAAFEDGKIIAGCFVARYPMWIR
jgi:hypothetical protein